MGHADPDSPPPANHKGAPDAAVPANCQAVPQSQKAHREGFLSARVKARGAWGGLSGGGLR